MIVAGYGKRSARERFRDRLRRSGSPTMTAAELHEREVRIIFARAGQLQRSGRTESAQAARRLAARTGATSFDCG